MASINHRVRVAWVIIFTATLFRSSSLAESYWEKKPFREWTRDEARKILRKSPWGKTHLVVTSGFHDSGGGLADRRRVGLQGDPDGPPDRTRSGDDRQRQVSRSDNPMDDPRNSVSLGDSRRYGGNVGGRPAESYRVFWYSSLRARQAIGRLRQLRGLDLKEQMQALYRQSKDHHIIAIAGSVTRFYRQGTLEEMMGKTILLSKKHKHKRIEPVQFVGPEKLRFPMALFLFPRVTDGKRSLDLSDGQVSFHSQQGPLSIKTSFKLKRMMTDGKLDL